jgi:hypothetical protein
MWLIQGLSCSLLILCWLLLRFIVQDVKKESKGEWSGHQGVGLPLLAEQKLKQAALLGSRVWRNLDEDVLGCSLCATHGVLVGMS